MAGVRIGQFSLSNRIRERWAECPASRFSATKKLSRRLALH
jgi:hypothetical protein